MPPKQNQASTDRLYGLTDAEMKTSISVLRLLAIDSNIPIDKVALAKLTGHEKPNSAYKIWTLAKAKLIAGTVDNGTADGAAPNASAAKPVKRARATTKAKSSGSKKAVAPVDDDEDEEEEDSGDELNEPAHKRAKKLGKQQSANDSC